MKFKCKLCDCKAVLKLGKDTYCVKHYNEEKAREETEA